MPEVFVFPPHEGLPDLINPAMWGLPPTVDGYIEPDLGVTTNELESGWTRCGRVTYAGDAGQPTMVFQGVKHNSQDFLYLSFLVRFDTSFSTSDRIILVFHPTVSAVKTANHRRIDIRPLTQDVGAGQAGVSDPLNPNPTFTFVSPEGFNIRSNRPEQNVSFYKYHLSTGVGDNERWDPIGVSNVTVRVRSWAINPAAGNPDHNWSVEIKLPKTTALGGADWPTLTDNFGFYFNVIRVCSASPPCDFIFDGRSNSQYTWPRANYVTGVGLLVDPSVGTATIEQHLTNLTDPAPEATWPSWLGEAIVGTAASGHGVRFIDGISGIGTTTTAPLVGTLNSSVDTRSGAAFTNTFAARIINEMTTPADKVKATFRIANWGVGGTTWPKVDNNIFDGSIPAGNLNPTAPATAIAPGGSKELRLQWGLTPAQRTAAQAMPFGSDRCLWVLLDSEDLVGVDFSEASVRRNLSFVNLSTHDAPAGISGDWEPAPPGGKHRIVLLVSKREIISTNYPRLQTRPPDQPPGGVGIGVKRQVREGNGDDGEGPPEPPDPRDVERTLQPLETAILNRYRSLEGKPASTWLVFNNAYRATGRTLTLEGVTTKVYEPIGGFGYVAEHLGPTTVFNYGISGGAELKQVSPDGSAYAIDVPHKGEVIIRTRLEAVENLGCWARICNFFKKLFGK